MNLSYLVRLLLLSLACFFLVHLTVGLAVAAVAPVALRMTRVMRARRAATFLLTMRLAPMFAGVFAVIGLCVPSYLWWEPDAGEDVGVACLAAALLGVIFSCVSMMRGARALARSRRYVRLCRAQGERVKVAGGSAMVMEANGHFVRLAGVLRPELVISRNVLNALSADQLEAAVLHEYAHRRSFDNLKRLLVLISPDVVMRKRFAELEWGWARFTEWAADDEAVGGDAHRSVQLASALVRVARMGAVTQAPMLVTSLLAEDLSARVERLLHPEAVVTSRWTAMVPACAAAAAAGMVAVLVMEPGALSSVHQLLEHLIN